MGLAKGVLMKRDAKGLLGVLGTPSSRDDETSEMVSDLSLELTFVSTASSIIIASVLCLTLHSTPLLLSQVTPCV